MRVKWPASFLLYKKNNMHKSNGKIWINLALVLGGPLFFLLFLEVVLWFVGVKPLYLSEDPFVGFASGQPLCVLQNRTIGGNVYVTNPAKISHFNWQSFPQKKAAGTYRIFTVGGSTTYGHPYHDPTSYSGWLRELLPVADPSRKWEVINAGGISYASYREAKLMEELIEYKPDLFVVYSGHNEFLEERTYRKTVKLPAFIRETSALLDKTRTYTVLRILIHKLMGKSDIKKNKTPTLASEVDDVLAKTIGPTSYTRNDTLHTEVLEHFNNSLERMARLAHSVGAEIIFVTTPSNEKDCSPFKSEVTNGLTSAEIEKVNVYLQQAHTLIQASQKELALVQYANALSIDNRNADIYYAAGKLAFELKQGKVAKKYFQKALEEDICPLRASPRMAEMIKQIAITTHSRSLDFVDTLEKQMQMQYQHNCLGEPDFLDHVHLDIPDYKHLALGLMDELIRMNVLHTQKTWGKESIDQVDKKIMNQVDTREQGIALHNLAKVINWAGKHEDAAVIAEKALAKDSTSLEAIWGSLFVGAAREREGKETEAIIHYSRAVKLDSNNPKSRGFLAGALMRSGKNTEATQQLSAALELEPNNPETQAELGQLYLGLGKYAEAAEHLALAVEKLPLRPDYHYAYAVALLKSNQIMRAEAEFRQTLALNPKAAQALVGLGLIAKNQGNMGVAIQYFAQALQMQPDLVEAQNALSQSLGGMSGMKP